MFDRARSMRTSAGAALVLALSLLAACGGDDPAGPAPEEQDTSRVIFRDGALPVPAYAGTRDAAIKDGPTDAARNTNWGREFLDTLGMRSAGAGLYDSRVLLRFDLTSLTNCWYVVSADLAVGIDSAGGTFDVVLDETTVPDLVPGSWTEGTGGLSGGVSWLTIDGDVPWYDAGGSTTGEEIARARVAPGDTVAVFPLPASLVQKWIARPAQNDGVLLRAAVPDAGLGATVHMRESPRTSRRPALSIVYIRYG